MNNFAVIDDDTRLLTKIKKIFHLQPDFYCVSAVESLELFWEEISPKIRLDIILLDIDLPGVSGLNGISSLRKRWPESEIIILTRFDFSDFLFKALVAGAGGYIIKDENIYKLPNIFNSILRGEAAISPVMARHLISYFNPKNQQQINFDLSEKEAIILKMFSEGMSYEEVANILNIKKDGIKYHVKNIYKKLNVKNKIEAVNFYKNLINGI